MADNMKLKRLVADQRFRRIHQRVIDFPLVGIPQAHVAAHLPLVEFVFTVNDGKRKRSDRPRRLQVMTPAALTVEKVAFASDEFIATALGVLDEAQAAHSVEQRN